MKAYISHVTHLIGFCGSGQEPVLVFPSSFMRILGDFPKEPRPLKVFDKDRRKKLLALANVLLGQDSYASTARTVEYLLRLCQQDVQQGPLAELRWLGERCSDEFSALINLDVRSKPVAAVIPQMRFTARFLRH